MSSAKSKFVSIIYLILFLCLFSFVLWKTRYGYANIDECFYLTIPYRLIRGDSLFLHEWHLSQTSSFLLLPLLNTYLKVFGDTTGIMLNFRVIYTIVWAMAALFFYYRLRRLSEIGAAIASLSFLLYAPFGLMALSYNSLGILMLLNSVIISATALKFTKLQYIISGLFFAGAVLCCPHLLLLYLLFTILSVYLLIRKNKTTIRCWLFFTIGSVILCALFCSYALHTVSLSKLIDVFPELFKDPEHQRTNIIIRTCLYFFDILKCNIAFPFCFALSVPVFLFCRIKEKIKNGFIYISLLCVAVQICFLIQKPYINYVMFPINLVGLYCFICSKNATIHKVFSYTWLPGLIYTYCIYLSSNQRFYAISSASTVMTVASFVMIFLFLDEISVIYCASSKCAVSLICSILMLVQFYAQISLRYSSVFWENGGMPAQTELASSGIEKGILMTKSRLEEYETIQRDIEIIRSDNKIKNILILSINTGMYLGIEKDMATFSAWLSGVNDTTISRLDTYYSLSPDKYPDGIYISKDNLNYAEHFENSGFIAKQLESGACLLTNGD